jgi:hypothetical protein
MKCPLTRRHILALLVFTAVVPAMSEAQTEVKVCAHPKGYNTLYRTADITVRRNGEILQLDAKPILLEGRCYSITLPVCNEEISIKAASSSDYFGVESCVSPPPLIKIAMSGDRWRVLTSAFGALEYGAVPGFDTARFQMEIAAAETVIADLPAPAQRAEAALYAALAEGNFSEAQQQANEVSSYLRQAGNDRLSLAYSSITYVAGFRAIGVDPLAVENPLVATMGATSSPFVVLSPEGQNVLELYQAERKIPAQVGVWDGPTASAISNIMRSGASVTEDPTVQMIKPVPRGLQFGDFDIDNTGRMVVR